MACWNLARIAVAPLALAQLLAAAPGGQVFDPAARAPSTVPTTRPIVVDERFPPPEQFAARVRSIARKYNVPLPGSSFAELRAIRLTEQGRPVMPGPDSAEMRLPAETNPFTCYVPLTYGDGRRAFGLVVWIAPEASVGMASLPGVLPQWLDVLERREVIWVEPGHAPNPSHSVWRVFAAIEAVRHARERYNIDPDRVYVAGFSGGGRIASHAAVFFPEVFSGAMAFMGCNFFRDVPVPGERNRVWPGFWPNPDMAIVKRAREESRLALVTGANDFNRPSTKATFDECIRDKWAHVTYIEVPGIGHSLPKAEYFEQAVAAVDGPLDEDLDARYAGARELEKKRKPGEACLAYERVARRAQGKPYAADAAARAADIRARLAERVAEIERQISAGRIDRAGPSARRLKLDFAPIADEQADDLIERIRAARSPTSAASSTSPTSQASTRPAPRRSP